MSNTYSKHARRSGRSFAVVAAAVALIVGLVTPASAASGPGGSDLAPDEPGGARAISAGDAQVQGEPPVAPAATPAATTSTADPDPAAAAAVGGTKATFVGHGQGHLRGMSQWGSYGYAVDYSKPYTWILDHYYGGTKMGRVANSTMTVRLRAQTGRDLIVKGTSLRVNNVAVGTAVVRVHRVGTNSFRIDRAGGCGGSWSTWKTITGAVTITRPSQNYANAASLMAICGASDIRYYGGSLKVVDNAGTIETVDSIPLETYLRGVVPRESPAYWGSGGGGKGINSLRSQAVAARSYALASTNASFAKTCDTTECQVYGGMFRQAYGGSVEALHSANSDKAVADTSGLVRVYTSNGAIARTEFGASSGGWTAGETFPAVQDLGDDTTDQTGLHNPYHTWTFTFSMAQAQAALGISGITDMRVTTTAGVGPTGGKATVMTVYTAGSSYRFDGDTVRRAFGLYSNWFRVTTDTAARRRATSIVQALYHDVLGRAADPSGLQTWVGRMVSGTSAKSVANSLAASAEYRNLLAQRLYGAALGRTGSAAGVHNWAGRLQSQPYWQVAGAFYGTTESYRHAGSNTDKWIDLVFRTGLGMAASPASVRYWKPFVARYGRQGAAERMLRSSAAGRFQLLTLYRTMLGTTPSTTAYTHYGPLMPVRGLYTMPGVVAGSAAYANRAVKRY